MKIKTNELTGEIHMASPMTQDEIADQLGMTRQSVQYILEKAYAKMRAEIKRRGIKPDDLLLDSVASDAALYEVFDIRSIN